MGSMGRMFLIIPIHHIIPIRSLNSKIVNPKPTKPEPKIYQQYNVCFYMAELVLLALRAEK